jgi:hypothetical protein
MHVFALNISATIRVLEDDRISHDFTLGPATTQLHSLRKLNLSSLAP